MRLLGRILFLVGAAAALAEEHPLRWGHFATVTHAQGVIAHELTHRGEGWFEERLGRRIEWMVTRAGPSVMAALAAGALDIAYVGPSPALNLFLRSEGEALKVVAAAARGGSALVVPRGSSWRTPHDLKGKRIASPQYGNTQDVALRHWLLAAGLERDAVSVVPLASSDQLALFLRGELQGSWAVEPWVTRLVVEGNGEIAFEDRDSLVTVLVVGASLIHRDPELVGRLVTAHEALTGAIVSDPEKFQDLFAAGFSRITRRSMPSKLLRASWERVRFDSSIADDELSQFAEKAQLVGLLPKHSSLSGTEIVWRR